MVTRLTNDRAGLKPFAQIATPIVKEHAIAIDGEVRHVGLEDLKLLLCGVPAR